tara:strand:- start:2587 stop:2700 length:114 start_codon:yes stop_codon:yes gene_type:complete
MQYARVKRVKIYKLLKIKVKLKIDTEKNIEKTKSKNN